MQSTASYSKSKATCALFLLPTQLQSCGQKGQNCSVPDGIKEPAMWSDLSGEFQMASSRNICIQMLTLPHLLALGSRAQDVR